MKNQKFGLLFKARLLFTALVVILGFGSILLSMKPDIKKAAATYGVAITANRTHYKVIKDITNIPPQSWVCNASSNPCRVASDTPASEGDLISISEATVLQNGDFTFEQQ